MGNTDSKVAFRQAVFRLAGATPPASSTMGGDPIPGSGIPPVGSPDRDAFFAQFWSIPTSADDVFTLLPPADLRRIRDTRPDAFCALFLAVFKHFVALATDLSWSAPGSNAASLVSSLAARAGMSTPSPTSAASGSTAPADKPLHMLNCIRLLTRLIPFIFELTTVDPSSSSSNPSSSSASPLATLLDQPIAPSARPTSPGTTSSSGGDPSLADNPPGTPLGHVLVFTVVQLLFRPGFTVPSHIPLSPPDNPNVDVNDDLSWDVCQLATASMASSQVSSRKSSLTSQSIALSPTGKSAPAPRRPSTTSQQPPATGTSPASMTSNRIEVLRLLLVCLSQSMYLPPPDLATPGDATSHPTSPTSPSSPPRSPSGGSPTRPVPPSAPAEMTRNPILAYLTRRASTPVSAVTPTSSSRRLPSAWAQLLVRSLLWAISAYTPASTWVPYDHWVLPTSDAAVLAMVATHVLAVLATAGSSLSATVDNRVLGMLAGLGEEAARVLSKALVKLLAARRKGNAGAGSAPGGGGGGGLLPGSTPAVVWFHEVLVLVFVLLQVSEAFAVEMDGDEVGDALVAELVGILTEYQSQQEMNLLRISIQILSSLSLRETTHAADLVHVIHALMSQPASHLAALYEPLLGILRRIVLHHPPTHDAAEKLVQLACIMGQPRYLVKGEHNWRLAVALFDVLEYALCAQESREVLDWTIAYHRELGQFIWVQLDQLEPPVVGKGKAKRKGEGWVPNAAWYNAWRAHVVLPQLEHVLTHLNDAGPNPKSKSMDTLAAELSTFPKDPPPSVTNTLDAYVPPPAVVAWLPGFVWGACYVRHKPGERSLGLWIGTTPRLFKVKVMGPPAPAAAPAPGTVGVTGA